MLKKILLSLSAFAVFAMPTIAIGGVSLASNPLKDGICATDPSASGCKDGAGDPAKKVNEMVKTIIDIFSWVVGVVAVIMVIIGGFKYITSGGESGSVTSAKNTILYAIVGLVIVALAQIIVLFVLGQATK